MILDRDLVRRIMRGQKREHRFPVVRTRAHAAPRRSGYTTGNLYPVQYVTEEGERPTALYVEVTAVDREPVAAMDDAAAVRTGFDSLEEFKETWPRKRWDGEMWVVRFQVAQERPRFLAALAGRAPASDYTSSPSRSLDPDAEVVDDATLKRYAEENRKRFRADLEAERERRKELPLSEQLARTLEDAKLRGADVSGDLRVIQRRIDAMKRKADAA